MIDVVPLPSEIALLDRGEAHTSRLVPRRGLRRPIMLVAILSLALIGAGSIALGLRSTVAAGAPPAHAAHAID